MVIGQATKLFVENRIRSGNQRIRGKVFVNKIKEHCEIQNLCYIDPSEIVYTTRSKFGCSLNGPMIAGGKWDKLVTPFEDRYKVKSLINHFEHGFDWEETEYYRKEFIQMKINSKYKVGSSKEEILDRLNRYDKIYEDIKNKGFRLSSPPRERISSNSKDLPRKTERPSEIGVAIGRKGQIFWQCHGQHRLTLAKILGLDIVPIQVHTRHVQWEKKRKEIMDSQDFEGQKSKYKIDHPDIPKDKHS